MKYETLTHQMSSPHNHTTNWNSCPGHKSAMIFDFTFMPSDYSIAQPHQTDIFSLVNYNFGAENKNRHSQRPSWWTGFTGCPITFPTEGPRRAGIYVRTVQMEATATPPTSKPLLSPPLGPSAFWTSGTT